MSRYVGPPTAQGRILFRGVHVVDPRDATVAPYRDVLVEDGRILAVEERGTHAAEDATVVEAEGKYLVPGYVDSHAHLLNEPAYAEASYALMLAHGVVGWRQMSGSPELLRQRDEGRLPTAPGAPALWATSGALLTPMNSATARAARAEVAAQAEQGADFVKAAMAGREGLLAALEEGRARGIPVAGHLPEDVDPREASEAGMRCIEHLGPGSTTYTAVSDEEQRLRAKGHVRDLPKLPRLRLGPLEKLLDKLLLKLVINPATMTSEDDAAELATADETYDEAKARELAELFVRNGTWQCPTLIRLHTQQFPNAPEHAQDPRWKYVDPAQRKSWAKSAAKFAELPEATRRTLAEHWDAQLRLTKVLAEAGVPMIAGTDANGAYGVIPGAALHDEFGLLAEAGLSPEQILRMATSAAAEFFGRSDHSGAVAAGFAADAVLLSANPLEDHAALSAIEGVLRAGQWWDRASLDRVLDAVAADPGVR